MSVEIPQARKLQFLPDDFKITVWSKLKPYYHELGNRTINDVKDLENWVLDRSELDAVVSEDICWRYIRLTQNSEDVNATEHYQYFIQEISPKIANYDNDLNIKLVESPFFESLSEAGYKIYFRDVENGVKLFRAENIPLSTEEKLKAKEYGALVSKMTVEIDGEELTIPKARMLLEETDRNLRASVYKKMGQRFLEDREAFDALFNQLRKIRHEKALNADFENYRDYKFQAMGRFDFGVKDCEDFHDSIASEVVPLVTKLHEKRKKALAIETLEPWDLSVDLSGKQPLRPFETVRELIQKSAKSLEAVDPFFGNCLRIMEKMERLDLDSRKGKHPGGYNMPLALSGVPFIFMNATQSYTDMHVLMHEAGHAVHSFLTRDIELTSSKNTPSEVAELASMTMELLSMDHWDIFFKDKDDLKRAKIQQLEGVIKTLPWVAVVDKFQHWVYTHPEHSDKERQEAWLKIYNTFTSSIVNQKGLEDQLKNMWHKQLHIFEVPFYYIEYGMAQLGAVAIWKRFREMPEKAIADYQNALKLGYTRTVREIYQTAGIEFNFAQDYVKDLMAFVWSELEALYD